MKNTVTIGTIWQDERTNKAYELTAISIKNNRLQLSSIDGAQEFRCMTEASLRKNYKLIAMSLKEFKPAVVTTPVIELNQEEVNNMAKQVKKMEEMEGKGEELDQKIESAKKQATPGRVELSDGTVIPGIRFLYDIAHKTEAETCKDSSVIYWLNHSKSGKELLEQYNAKVVYGKPLTKK